MKNFIILKLFSFCLTLFCIIYWINATLPVSGPCPTNMTAMSNFDMEKFLGRWHLYSRYPHLAEIMPKCISINIEKDGDKYIVTRKELVGKIKLMRSSKSNILTDKDGGHFIQNTKFSVFPSGIDTWVLDTDYENYAVRFMCIDVVGVVSFQWAAIYTRQPQPTPELINKTEEIVTKNGLELNKMKKVDQHTCPPV